MRSLEPPRQAARPASSGVLSTLGAQVCPIYLGVSVFASLGGGHLHNFAGTSLQHHVAVLAQSGALHGEGGRGARVAGVELEIGVCHVAMGQGRCRTNTTRSNTH